MTAGPFNATDPLETLVRELAGEVRSLSKTVGEAERQRLIGQGEQRAWRANVDERLGRIEQHASTTNGKVADLVAERIAREAVEKARPDIEAQAIAAAAPALQAGAREQVHLRGWKALSGVVAGLCAVVMTGIATYNLTV